MSKVALYFRRWKNYTRQKNVGENFTFATKLTDMADIAEDESENGFTNDFELFQVKFLGSTTVNAAKSEEATAYAIKRIITVAKASSKKLQRLRLSICPRGIETFDAMTGETLHKVSIYKISYCSADAAHSNVFAFIASAELDDDDMYGKSDELTCYAFLCAKRKVAYNLTVTVAKNFERAYDQWKKGEQNKSEQCNSQRLNGKTLQIKVDESNELNRIENLVPDRKGLLIDFNSDTNASTAERRRQLLQNKWVSFDEEPLMDESPSGKVFENSLWDMNVLCS